jgi:nucleoside-diphosphate-sugar epimerase
MSKKVLITGANGFIGSFIVKQAKQQGLYPYAGIRKGADTKSLASTGVDIVHLDYENVDQLANVLDHYKFDYIIHNAGMTRSPSLSALVKVNKDYMVNILDAMRKSGHQIEKFLYVSSLAAYGPADKVADGIVSPSTPPKPVTNYGHSKLTAEHYLTKQKDISWLIVRPTAVYGPGEKDLLTIFQTLQKGVDLVAGFIPQRLTFIYVDDLAKLMITMVKSAQKHKAYFASDGEVYLGSTLSAIIKKSLGRKTIKIKLPIPLIRTIAYMSEKIGKISHSYPVLNIDKVNEIKARNWSVDISETKKDFGFEPEFTLDKGIPVTVAWYRKMKWI